MKHTGVITGLLAGALLVMAGAARAQVSVEVVMDQGQFLPGETVPVAVRVVNHSGQTLHFGKEDWLSFNVEGMNGFVVVKVDDPPMVHDFDVPTGKVATQHIDLAPYFTLTQPGQFKVSATVTLKAWDQELTSQPKSFDVIRGVKLWEQDFGVPDSSGTNGGPPEVRKYVLQKATYLQHLRLYLRLTDETGQRTFRVLGIGPMTSFSDPKTRLDAKNNLHLLYASGARIFSYTEVSPEGVLLKRQMYDYMEGAPRLAVDKTGAVSVNGGHRRVSADDVPSGTETSTNASPDSKTKQ
jgi:hypothetical protein